MDTKAFKLVSASANTGPFGHTGYIVVARDGDGWEVERIIGSGNPTWTKGDIIIVPLDLNGRPQWERLSCEVTRPLAQCPPDLLKKWWRGYKTGA